MFCPFLFSAIVLHSAVRIIPMLQQVCDGLKLYGFQDLLAQHSETWLQIFVPGYLKKVVKCPLYRIVF